MAYTKSDKSDSPMRRRGMGRRRKKVCVFCGKESAYTIFRGNKNTKFL